MFCLKSIVRFYLSIDTPGCTNLHWRRRRGTLPKALSHLAQAHGRVFFHFSFIRHLAVEKRCRSHLGRL
jgi:hypothetical protein